ncbi:MAG: glycosyltransferase [Patescibacteria group bacterium]|nr:glycosyltransferase [Patescibacteria group bacterium]
MKIALVTDLLTQLGGAEKVLEVLHEIYPEAPVYTLVYDEKKTKNRFSAYQIKTSFLQKLPLAKNFYRWYLPLMPRAIEKFDFHGYDFVFSICSAFTKGVIVPPKTKSICYLLTPTRYLWVEPEEYLRNLRGLENLARFFLPKVLDYLRKWDLTAIKRPNYLIAISQFIKKRIEKHYQRTPDAVIYSPVEVDRFFISKEIDRYFLIISRPRYYKRVDLVIQAFNKLKIPLKIIGMTREEGKNLCPEIKSNIEFLGYLSEEEKAQYLAHCQALIHPQEEDFGITAVEAMASGRPVIAYRAGGALETVIENETGQFFDEQTWEALADTVIRFKPEEFNPEKIRTHSQKFSKEIFKEKIKNFINNL